MKQQYIAPDVIVHGTVQSITAAVLASDRQDRVFNANAELVNTSTGSYDECIVDPRRPYMCPPDAV